MPKVLFFSLAICVVSVAGLTKVLTGEFQISMICEWVAGVVILGIVFIVFLPRMRRSSMKRTAPTVRLQKLDELDPASEDAVAETILIDAVKSRIIFVGAESLEEADMIVERYIETRQRLAKEKRPR